MRRTSVRGSKRLQFRIIHKGLLILLVPFALETMLFGLLFHLNQESESLAKSEASRARFIQQINDLMEDSGVAWISIISRMMNGRTKFKGMPLTPKEYHFEVDTKISRLKAIPVDSPNRDRILQTVTDMCAIQGGVLDCLEDNKEAFGDAEKFTMMVERIKTFQTSFHKARARVAELKQLMAQEQTKIENALNSGHEQRQQVKVLLISCFIFQLAITVGIIFLFLNHITSRLNLLVQNARLLPSGHVLKEHVKGSDEIAYLDSTLHDASKRLEAAAQNRQSIMGMIAHDIRSPLMSSSLLLEKLVKEIYGNEAGMRTSARLKNTFTQLNILVEDLLALDKLESGMMELNLELFNIKALVNIAIDTALPQAEKRRVSIINRVPDCEIVADQGRILQVLNNLLSNAVKYSPQDMPVDVRGVLTDKDVTVSVVDQGKGISDSEIPYVFDKFFQSGDSNSKQGYGLGLAICQLIIANHQGKIGVSSKIGKGSTFWFTLPLDSLDDV